MARRAEFDAGHIRELPLSRIRPGMEIHHQGEWHKVSSVTHGMGPEDTGELDEDDSMDLHVVALERTMLPHLPSNYTVKARGKGTGPRYHAGYEKLDEEDW